MPPEMTIPEVRERLHGIAAETGNAELDELANQLVRRSHGRKAPATRHGLNALRKVLIRTYAEDHPDVGEFDIAILFGVNQGRVSEAIYGKRGAS